MAIESQQKPGREFAEPELPPVTGQQVIDMLLEIAHEAESPEMRRAEVRDSEFTVGEEGKKTKAYWEAQHMVPFFSRYLVLLAKSNHIEGMQWEHNFEKLTNDPQVMMTMVQSDLAENISDICGLMVERGLHPDGLDLPIIQELIEQAKENKRDFFSKLDLGKRYLADQSSAIVFDAPYQAGRIEKQIRLDEGFQLLGNLALALYPENR